MQLKEVVKKNEGMKNDEESMMMKNQESQRTKYDDSRIKYKCMKKDD